MTTLDLIGVTKDAKTAGPGKRFELFTKGCIRGVVSPCKGCFNEETWTFEGDRRTFKINELTDIIERDAWNRQVTFCGGEPMLQAIALTALAKELRERDPRFHIVMYTAYKLDTLLKYGLKYTWTPKRGEGMLKILEKHSRSFYAEYPTSSTGNYLVPDNNEALLKVEFTILTPQDVVRLMEQVNLIVDGDFQIDKRMTTDKYMHDGWFVGSTNQRVIYTQSTIAFWDYQNGEMNCMSAQEYNDFLQSFKQCKCCGHYNPRVSDFCSSACEIWYFDRIDFLNKEGIKVKEGTY